MRDLNNFPYENKSSNILLIFFQFLPIIAIIFLIIYLKKQRKNIILQEFA